MKNIPLTAEKLALSYPEDHIPWQSTEEMPNPKVIFQQPRMIAALDLALAINEPGYNVYVSGSPMLGRMYMVKNYLAPKARKMKTPPDLVYVNNFDKQDQPCLLTLPAGVGKKLKLALAFAFEEISRRLIDKLEHPSYISRHDELMRKFQDRRTDLLHDMDEIALGYGFNLDVDDEGGLTLTPMIEGKRLSESEFRKLDISVRQSMRQQGNRLMKSMSGLVQKLSKAERVFRDEEQILSKKIISDIASSVLEPEFAKIRKLCPDNPPLEKFFADLLKDISQNPDAFLPKDPMDFHVPQTIQDPNAIPKSPESSQYEVNLFVDHSNDVGAPLIFEHNPTSPNLLGCVESESELGAVITNFKLIRAGSLHMANGGFLVIRIEDILQNPASWEGLMRALQTGMADFDKSFDFTDSNARMKSIAPEKVPISLKIILIGTEDTYEELISQESRFEKFFKIKAQLTSNMPLNTANVRKWLLATCHIVRECDLLPFDRSALAHLIDYSAYLAEDREKLSLEFPVIRDVMVESSAFAKSSKSSIVSKKDVERALSERIYRMNLVEEAFLEEYDKDLVKVKTDGEGVGYVNGLAVSWYGGFECGIPQRISCSIGVGRDGILDLEREADLGGPIHTKAMLILKSYLTGVFAKNKPLILTGSICFEQNYSGIEGDSASGAELAALLSAISNVPIKLCYAFTGAVNQVGDIMAVGGVSVKIEGFFKICHRRGLTGKQGVLIPQDNVKHLMLSKEVCDAVKDGKFSIIPITHIRQAMEILTGMPAGRPTSHGFTKNSLYEKVDERLRQLGYMAEHAYEKSSRHKNQPRSE